MKTAPDNEQLQALKERLEGLPPGTSQAALALFAEGYSMGKNEASREDKKQEIELRRESRLFVTSIGFLLLAAIGLFLKQDARPAAQSVLFLIAALGAGGFTAYLPGTLALTGRLEPQSWLHSLQFRAGGGVAMAILTFVLLHVFLSR